MHSVVDAQMRCPTDISRKAAVERTKVKGGEPPRAHTGASERVGIHATVIIAYEEGPTEVICAASDAPRDTGRLEKPR